jgi:hypothetical protein
MPDQLERCITIRHDVAYSDAGAAAAVYQNQMDEYQLATFQQVIKFLFVVLVMQFNIPTL